MSQPEAELERLTAVLRDLNPELDELARARILARTNAAIDAGASDGQRTRRKRLAFGGAAVFVLAAAAALLLFAPWRGATPTREPSARAPHARGGGTGEVRVPTARDGVPAAPAVALVEPGSLQLVPYSLSGAGGLQLAAQLGTPVRVLEIPARTIARAAVGAAVRLTLVGPARVELADASAARSELLLMRGQLAIDYERARDGDQLHVRTAQASVRVVGTRFAVVAEDADTRVGVIEGTVEVEREARAQRLEAGRAWRALAGIESALPAALRALLLAHGEGLRPPPAPHGLLSIEGNSRPVRVRVADRLLGHTPLWALVPVGPVAVTLDDGHARSILRTEVAAARTTELALQPPAEPDAASLYADAERALRAHDRAAARRALQQLIARFPESPQAEPALYELAQLAPDCPTQRPLLQQYLARHPQGRFAPGAQERLSRCP